LTWT